MPPMRIALLLVCAGLVGLSSCTTCYSDRFCQELVDKPRGELVALLGAPTTQTHLNGVETLEWSYDGTFTREREEGGYWDTHKDKKGNKRSYYVPSKTVQETVRRVAIMRFHLVKSHVVSYSTYYEGHNMCNHFIPQECIERYRQEKAHRD